MESARLKGGGFNPEYGNKPGSGVQHADGKLNPKNGNGAIQNPVRPERLSKGERDFESHPMGERRTAAHASTVLSQETAFLSMYIMGLADMKNRSNSSKQRQFHGNALPHARGLYRSARAAVLRS